MILFYHGPDTYRLRSSLHDLDTSYACDADTEEGRSECERILKYPSLIPQRTVVVLRNVLADAETAGAVGDLLEKYSVAGLDDITVIACHESVSHRESVATKKLVSYLTRHATETRSFELLVGRELEAWVAEFCAQRGCAIHADARAAVIRRTGGDSWALAMELEKLCAYSPATAIDLSAVNTLVAIRHEQDEWRLTNALSAGNKRGALTTLWERLDAGTPVPLLVGMCAHATRTLLTRKDAPYDRGALVQAHRSLAELDRTSKNGLADGQDGLFVTLLNL